MDWRAAPTGKQGRQPTFSDAAIQTCLTLKVLFRLPLRQVIGLVESLLKLADLDWPVPDFSTLSRPLPGQPLGRACLHAREGPEKPDGGDPVSRLQGAAAPVARTTGPDTQGSADRRGNGPLSADCFAIACRATDGAYDTRTCHNAVADRGAHAVIPTRRNAKPWRPLSWFASKPLSGGGQHPGLRRATKS